MMGVRAGESFLQGAWKKVGCGHGTLVLVFLSLAGAGAFRRWLTGGSGGSASLLPEERPSECLTGESLRRTFVTHKSRRTCLDGS